MTLRDYFDKFEKVKPHLWAKDNNIPKTTLYELLKGTRKNSKVSTLRRISEATKGNVRLEDML